jgi:FkbM family methyltransferase
MGARLRHLEERLGMLEKSAAPLPTCSGLCFRTGTMDQGIWRDVVENNEYRLPEQFRPADVLLDIGTHIGAFSYAALVRGAGHVWAFEANAANWLIARQNLRRFEGRVHLVHKAIWRSDRPVASLCYLNSPDPTNTGGGSVYGTERHNAVECLAFDQAVDQALAGSGAPRLRLLKLDCEGSEWPILLTSRRLHLVDGICGEYHASGAHIPPSAQVDGYTEYTPEVLRDFLQKQGFAVHLQPTVTSLGHFWATRTTPPPDC